MTSPQTPSEAEIEEKYSTWLEELEHEVIEKEFGYERGEFTVYASHWRELYDQGLTPRQAWQHALDGHANERKEREQQKTERYARIVSEDDAAAAKARAPTVDAVAAGQTSSHYEELKRCCTVCDRKKKCHVCGEQTLFACSDCRINFQATVYVCAKDSCQDAHEQKCFSHRPALPHAVPAGWKMVPIEPGTCELDDSPHLLAFAVALHANISEEKRPNGWSDFSDAQRDRLKAAYRAMLAVAPSPPDSGAFALGDRVRKKRGSQWHGEIVGTYKTKFTPEGYCVESERERESVQIYPVQALERNQEKSATIPPDSGARKYCEHCGLNWPIDPATAGKRRRGRLTNPNT